MVTFETLVGFVFTSAAIHWAMKLVTCTWT